MTDQAGAALTPTAPLTLVFRLYESPVGGMVLWEEVQPNVVVIGGRFSVLLGSRAALPDASKFSKTLYLGITVDDGDPSTPDAEMRPRQAIVPVIFATKSGRADKADNADKLNGFDWSELLLEGSHNPGTGIIKASKIDPALLKELTDRVSNLEKRLDTIVSIGDIIASPLDENQFRAVHGPGWVLADGRNVAGTKYAKLKGASVPKLNGRFILGADNMGGKAAKVVDRPEATQVGAVGGNEKVTLTVKEMPVHTHGPEQHNAYFLFVRDDGPSGNTVSVPRGHGWFDAQKETAERGGGQPHENMPPFLTLNFYIRVD